MKTKTAKKNATQNVTEAQTEEKIENVIDYESDGEPVKDATVFGEIHMYFLRKMIKMKFSLK